MVTGCSILLGGKGGIFIVIQGIREYIFFFKETIFSNIGLELIFGYVLSMLEGKGERGFIN